MKSQNLLPSDHDRERAPLRRQQDPQAAKTGDAAGSTAALLRSLQRSVGNQAVNTILRKYELQRQSAYTSSSVNLVGAESSQAIGTSGSLQREMFDDEEELQRRTSASLQREMIDDDEELQRRAIGALQREMVDDDEELQRRTVTSVQREMIDDEEIQAKPEVGMQGGPLSNGLAARIQASHGTGESLNGETRTRMESAFGTSFGDVRVHADEEASALNHGVNAVAFTTGSDIFFRSGTYQPNTSVGQNLLTHELTHVVQQRSMGGGGPMTVRPAGDSYEVEADAMASSVSRRLDDAASLT
jgi:hypothetical protein